MWEIESIVKAEGKKQKDQGDLGKVRRSNMMSTHRYRFEIKLKSQETTKQAHR